MSPCRAPTEKPWRSSERKRSATSFLAVAEDDGVLEFGLGADEFAQDGALFVILAVRGDETLRHGRGGRSRLCDFDTLWILQESIGELLDLRRHGCREEQRLASERDHLGDAFDIGDETHVEHAVGLVDDEDLDAAHQELAALEMVEQAAGRADQHIGAALELAVLVFEGNAADQEGDVEAVVLAVFLEILGDLSGEFARRFENQRAGHARTRTALSRSDSIGSTKDAVLPVPVCAMPQISRRSSANGMAPA